MAGTRTRKRTEPMTLEGATRLLGVDSGATVADVMAARRDQAKRWHPDVNPSKAAVEKMRHINLATDMLCDHIRRGGYVDGIPRRNGARGYKPPDRQPRVFEVRFAEEVGVPVLAPDRHARVELDVMRAVQGGTRTVHFVRREPHSCHFCAGLGATPTGPKRFCPTCRGELPTGCTTCEGRGWIHVNPGSCRHCDGTGAALVERSVHLVLPPGITEVRRTLVRGWGDVADDGTTGNLWVDLVPSKTAVASVAPWRFEHYGHNWPKPEGRVESGWLAIRNTPLPDNEMRELGFWRDSESAEWVREAPSEGPQPILDLIRQRQFFVPQPAG